MNIGDICSRAVVSIGVNDPVRQAAEMMRNYHVGSLVVTESSDGGLTPVGMLTDRDIVVGIVAKDVDPLTVTVGDIMSPEPLIAAEDDDVAEILEDMRKQGVRRIPVVDEADKLIGIFALDDLLQLLAVQMDMTAGTEVGVLISALRDPRCYRHAVTGIEVVETHASWVLLTGEHAYKIKKPVNLGFLDYSTLAKRRAACTEELRLSRALAPELYLDVVPVTGSVRAPVMNGAGTPIEYALHMREFDRSQQLDALLAAGRLGERDMDTVADYVAAFHLGAPRAAAPGPYGVPAELQAAAQDNFATLAPLLAGHYAAELARVQAWSAAEYLRCRELMENRRAQGWIRECHGDLHLADLARYGGRLLAFDRIEFDPVLRWLDVLNDTAFLVMDLLARDRKSTRLNSSHQK